MDRYPPLNSLLAFDAAMRTNSFSMAARDLCVTPGAVGQQIHKLEEWLGVQLFVRSVRQIEPTPDGLIYWKRIQPALSQIRDASRSLKDSRSQGVWLSMPPGFAAKWFTRRMAHFLTRHPEIELHLNSSAAPVDFESGAADLAIRYFEGDDPSLESMLLFLDDARAYCSPAYANKLDLKRPDDLVRATLLRTTLQPHWPTWLQRFSSLSDAEIAQIPAIHFDQSLMAIEAAKQGQGVVMTSVLLCEEEVATGVLVEPFGLRMPLASGYHLVHPKRAALRPPAEAFKRWIGEQAGETRL